jgi:anti-sigma regulatory factor (Ser/Thr protein kinase)
MVNDITETEVQPDPERVIEGLRDTGYQLETAIEDIIDNSIAADATKIAIELKMDHSGDVEVYISDNGYGMNHADLKDAMKYGSKQRPNPKSLGKFGLGLKTASTAFCRKLSVISRAKGSTEYHKATWDLDHVAAKNKWLLQESAPEKTEISILTKISGDCSGTLVIWQKVDRLLRDYSTPGGARAKKALDQIADNLSEHVAMVFQRFLDESDDREENVEILINNKKVAPYNPFCPGESDIVAQETVPVEINGAVTGNFFIRAFVLPNKWEFSSDFEYQKSRPGNQNQGIYVYRENRLIHGPAWMRMYSKEPHMSLLRVEFSFDHTLDDVFNIDIKKSRILLNDDLYKWLKDTFIPPCRRAAEQRYRRGKKQTDAETAKNLHDGSNVNIGEKESDVSVSTVTIVDSAKNEVEVKNKYGTTKSVIKIVAPKKPGEVHVQAVATIEDNLLWEPCLIDGHKAVSINTGHAYYSKVYLPNRNSDVTIQGLDSLLWALCEAEFSTMNDKTKRFFEEMRIEISRILRTLVEDLPESTYDDKEE